MELKDPAFDPLWPGLIDLARTVLTRRLFFTGGFGTTSKKRGSKRFENHQD